MRNTDEIRAEIKAHEDAIARCKQELNTNKPPLPLVADGANIRLITPTADYWVATVNASSHYDAQALAHKFAAADYLYLYCKWAAEFPLPWYVFMKQEFGLDVPIHSINARDYTIAIAEGREPTKSQKAAWGLH
jgi:hypothetical protein